MSTRVLAFTCMPRCSSTLVWLLPDHVPPQLLAGAGPQAPMSGVSALVGAAGRGDVAAVAKALKLRLSVDSLHEVRPPRPAFVTAA